MESKMFPILDFNEFLADKISFSRRVFQASHEWGFLVLTNTCVDKVERMFDLSREFFDLPLDEKREKVMNEQAVGYDGKNMTTFAASEGLSFGMPAGHIVTTSNLPSWCTQSRRQEIEEFKAQCYNLSSKLMECFALELGFEEDYFTQAHQHLEPGNNLKFIKYPRIKDNLGDIPRLSEHTDWGSITFVFSSQGGLEIRDPNNNWCPVPVVPGGIIVNIGDAMSLWTGKVLKSTLHRITWENLPMDQDRFSIAYFTNPNYNALLNPQRSALHEDQPALTYRDFYKTRLRLTYGSIQDHKSGKNNFEDVDPKMLAIVRSLEVANHGILESNQIKAA